MNVTSPEFILNPYPFYAERRAQNPVLKVNPHTWTVTGFAEMSQLLAQSACGRGNIGQLPRAGGDTTQLEIIKANNPALDIFDRWMLFKNPPEHTQARKSIADEFTLKMMDGLEQKMQALVQQLIAEIKTDNTDRTFDLVPALAYQLPLRLICKMLGIPESDWQRFHVWTSQFSSVAQSDFHLLPPQKLNTLNHAANQLMVYFSELIQQKKTSNENDLITKLMSGGMSDKNIAANCVFLLFAGQETTTFSMSNMLHALLTHPVQLEKLRSSPELAKQAVEESLRYDPPIQMTGRLALDDIRLDKIAIDKGCHMHLFLGAAGRDSRANPEPDRYDIERSSIKHLAFARGAHHCLGASLARRELEIILTEFLPAFPELRLNGSAVRQNTWIMRGFQSLPVQY